MHQVMLVSCNITKDIGKCTDDKKLIHLAQLIYDHFIHLFEFAPSQTPESSFLTSDLSFDTLKAEESPMDQRTAKVHALIRDKFRCVVTSAIDSTAYHNQRQLVAEALDKNLSVFSTKAAYIFPASISKGISGEDNLKPEDVVNAQTIVNHLSGYDIKQELDDIKIHHLENILTLAVHVHAMFNRLDLWFEEMDTHHDMQHTYQVCGDPQTIRALPPTVTFTTDDPLHLPLPSPHYLGIHAACCKVAWLSGAKDYIEKTFGDMEEIQAMASDGSSAEALHCALIHALPSEPVF
ncbi:uncharacterized protein BJ212DRAFT_1577643 [Suillus subaureus]|uniref:HNH nuclease domain-containing protein n=1 Tax=Suillus subaureus TaxID=48587 RepID=A0A9P7JCX7_9AGAM|nr:uncharacterized protein BJ212DRAFT_1577643 [Suillus subaureus]KAG1815097.1 hypothetical protein BJ212DRAFT_1577643 [Suillus subaureus]